MPVTAASLLVKVTAGTGSAETALGRVSTLFRNVGVVAVTATAATAVASLKMAGDFQAGMTTLVTGAGESQRNLKLVSDGVLQLADDTGTSTKQLTDGMFMIESAGYHGAAGLAVLKDAAEGAKVGNADLGTTADALTTILKDYPNVTNGAAGAMNELIATVASGKTHMEDLATAMAAILPTASASKVGLNDVMGAMATMTAEGVPAANAATYLRQTILALDAPAKKAQTALESVGLSSADVATEMQKSLPGALQMITDAVGKKFPEGSAQYVAALKDIAGGSKQMQGILDLTGQHMSEFQGNVKHVTEQVKNGGTAIQGWALVQQTFNFQMDRAKEAVETLMISLGTRLLPIATQVAAFVANNLGPTFTQLMDIIAPVRDIVTQTGLKLSGLGDSIRRMSEPFDEGGRAIGKLFTVVHPLPPMFDEASTAVKKVVDVAKPFPPLFDEGSRAVAKLAPAVKSAQSPISILGDVLKTVVGFVKSDVIPTVQQLATFFVTDMVPALNLVWKDFQTDVLPTLGKVASFVRTDVLPVVEKLALWFVTKVVPAAMQVVKWFGDDILPVLRQVWQVVATQVIPVVQGIANNVMANLVPAIERLISKLAPVLIPIFHQVGDVLKNQVGPALNTAIGFVSGLINVITTIIDKIGDFLGMLGNVKNAIGNAFSGLNNIPVLGGLLPHFAQGGVMGVTGMALVGEEGPEIVKLPGGAQVTPVPRNSGNASGVTGLPAGMQPAYGAATATANGIPLQFNLYFDGKKIAQLVTQHQPSVVRNGTGKRSI